MSGLVSDEMLALYSDWQAFDLLPRIAGLSKGVCPRNGEGGR